MAQEYVEQGHLGGYIAGGDYNAIYPELWTWLVNDLRVNSVLDIGCGDGVSLKEFRKLGCRVLGIEGIKQEDPDIIQHDFCNLAFYPDDNYDLAWMCEFVEHVEEKYIANIIPSIRKCKLVLMTHAVPGQSGYHHVNCRDAEYWKGFMTAAGFAFDPNLTGATKSLAMRNPSPYAHYVRSGLAFQRS